MKIEVSTAKDFNGKKISTISIKFKNEVREIKDARSDDAIDFLISSISELKKYELTYGRHIKNDLKLIEPGQSKHASLRGKSVEEYRVYLSSISKTTGIKYKTKKVGDKLLVSRPA